MPGNTDPVSVVQRMFAAFRTGDLAALVETVHLDSQWTFHGANPRLSSAEFSGKDRARRFLERIIERIDATDFRTDQFVTQGSTVVIFGGESGLVRATGSPSGMSGRRSMWWKTGDR